MQPPKPLKHMRDVVEAVIKKGSPPRGAAAPRPPAPRAMDLTAAPRRPAASAPGRLDHGRAGDSGSRSPRDQDFERCTLWVGDLRQADATEARLKQILGRWSVRSMAVRRKPDQGEEGHSWALVTFFHADAKEAAEAAAAPDSEEPLTGSSGQALRVDSLRMAEAFHSDGQLQPVWKEAKAKAERSMLSRPRAAVEVDAPPPKRRRQTTDDRGAAGRGGASAATGAETGALRMARALKSSGDVADIAEVEKQAFIAKGTSGAVFRARWNGMNVAAKFYQTIE